MRKNFIFLMIFLMAVSVQAFAAKPEWKEHKGKHFIIYFKNAPEDFIKSVEEMSENYYDEIADNLGFTRYKGWTWDERALIYIYDDDQDYIQSAKQYSWSHGSADPKDKIIRTFPSAAGFFDSTLPHEIGHIIFREFVGLKADVPLWFEEGVAMYQEKAKRFGSHKAVKEAMESGQFLELSKLNKLYLNNQSPQELVQLFYAESASIVYYMINDLGQQRFVNFCRQLQDGTPFEWVLHTVYVRFKSLDDLNKSWVGYLKQ